MTSRGCRPPGVVWHLCGPLGPRPVGVQPHVQTRSLPPLPGGSWAIALRFKYTHCALGGLAPRERVATGGKGQHSLLGKGPPDTPLSSPLNLRDFPQKVP